jgi:acetyl esterase
MTDHAKPERRMRRWGRGIVLTIGALLTLVTAYQVLGAYVPEIDHLYGSLVVSLWPGWMIVAPIVGALLVWKGGRGVARTVLLAIAAATALGAAIALAWIVSVAQRNDVHLSVPNAFGFSQSLATVRPDEIVTYTRDEGEDLTLRLFRPTARAPAVGWPVYMHIHGGGWVEGSNADQSAEMRWFADRGWLVISVGYSLSNDRRHLWDLVIGQIGCAMAWADANVSSRGGDPARLALRGGSAGGNLALNAAYMANAGTLRSSCGGRVPRVRSVTPIYPGVDLVSIYRKQHGPTGLDTKAMATKYLGGTPEQVPERYKAVGSATHISAAAPPTLLFLSENDHVVPPDSMAAFVQQARQAGITVEVVSVPFAEHGFDLTGIGSEIVRQVSLRFINAHDRRATPRLSN